MRRFRQFVCETPKLVDLMTPDALSLVSKKIRDHIKQNHSSSKKIGESSEGTYHKIGNKDSPIYYHMVNNTPREISLIGKEDNKQSFTEKGDGGSSEHNKWFMKHHAKINGYVSSDKLQTKGSKKLWKDLSGEKDKEFSVYHYDGKSLNHVDSEYLNKNENKIWGKEEKHKDHKLVLKYNAE